MTDYLLVVDRSADVWWQVHRDGTRTRVGDRRAAEALARTWLAWRTPLPIWIGGAEYQPPDEYVGDSYTVRFLSDPAELDHWPDVTPTKEYR